MMCFGASRGIIAGFFRLSENKITLVFQINNFWEIIMLTLTIRFNHIQAQHNGALVEHRGAFSNSRMIVADFAAFETAVKTVLAMAADKQMYPKPSRLFGLITRNPICLDVRENLADGLSPVEYKVLLEVLLSLGARMVKPEQILYHGKIPFQAA